MKFSLDLSIAFFLLTFRASSIVFVVVAQNADEGECSAEGGTCADTPKPQVEASSNSNVGDGTSTCADKEDDCYSKALSGQCQEDPFHMLANCPLSCKVCQQECVDLHPACFGWANEGECELNPTFMLSECYKSCICDPPSCKDIAVEGTRQCRLWAWHGECETNAIFMNAQCRKSCKRCSDKEEPEWPCEDDPKFDCKKWSDDEGLCDGEWRAKMNTQMDHIVDSNFIVEFCPIKCDVCHVHLDERDLALGIGVPQTYPENEEEKKIHNKVRRKVSLIHKYVKSLSPEIQEFCKLGFDMCARLFLSGECEPNQHEDVIKYACAAACGTCEELVDDPVAIAIAKAWHQRGIEEFMRDPTKRTPVGDPKP